MKGQLSIEYLLLMLIVICLLSLSAFALLKIRNYSDATIHNYELRRSAISLDNTINEICALGDGNRREFFIDTVISISSEPTDEKWAISFSDGNNSVVRSAPCKVEGTEITGLVIVENEKGIIKITKQ